MSNKVIQREVVLASGSLWRRRLLKKKGIDCKVHVSRFEEQAEPQPPQSGARRGLLKIKCDRREQHFIIGAKKLAAHNARGKAESVAKHHKNAIVIGVDTIGVYKNQILGKPADLSAARKMLQTLCGHTHRVISGLHVIDTVSGKHHSEVCITKVTFRKFTPEELEKYLKSNHWKGKAGAYAIQGRAKGFVEEIDGDITNVIGLPIETLQKILAKIKKGS
jgi:septum formation protein